MWAWTIAELNSKRCGVTMPKIRKCSKCGEAKLRPVSRNLQIYNSVIQHVCEGCGGKVEITPPASIGLLITVGLLALGFWYAIMFWGNSHFDIYTVLMFGVAVVAFAFVTLPPIIKLIKNPEILETSAEDDELPINKGAQHFAKRPILWLERLGMIAGLLAPLIFVAIILGVAALIGYINFTYFE